MAIYHCSVKTISRSAGRSATAAAAYRSGSRIVDERTGEIHDYSRKRGVLSATIIAPPGAPEWAHDRAAIWNQAEQSETRKNSTVAREFEVALPHELTHEQRQQLALEFGREIMQRHACVVDVALHEPDRGRVSRDEDDDYDTQTRAAGDQRNHHAHILCSTRRLTADGFTEKTRELDERTSGEVGYWRARWAQLANEHLERAGRAERIDHRSHAERGIDREPTQHLGPAATGYERRTGEPSWLRQVREQEAAQARLEAAAKAAQEAAPVDASIIDLETQLRGLLDERRDRQKVAVHLLGQWQAHLKDRPGPEVAQVAEAMRAITAREPGALERGEDLTCAIRAREVAALERAEAQRQAEAHRQRLEAEQAAKRAQEAAWLAGLAGTATPSPFGAGGRIVDPATARGAAPESAEKLAPERRGGDSEQQRQDSFRALLERQQREAEVAKEAPAQAPDYDRDDWGMDGP